MADTVYGMGQYRYTKGTQCMEPISYTLQYLDWQTYTDTAPFYRDIIFVRDEEGFQANVPYYFKFAIPRNLNYNYDVAIKLVNTNQLNDYIYTEEKIDYQFIKYISAKQISQQGSNNNKVVLYQINEENNSDAYPGTLTNHARTAIEYYQNIDPNTSENFEFTGSNQTDSRYSGQFYPINNPGEGYEYYPYHLYENKINNTFWMFKYRNEEDNTNYTSLINDTTDDKFGASSPEIKEGIVYTLSDLSQIMSNKTWYPLNDNDNDEEEFKIIFNMTDDSSEEKTLENSFTYGDIQSSVSDPSKIKNVSFNKTIISDIISILTGINDIILNWTWETDPQDEVIAQYECIFTPEQGGFNAILLQLQRIAEDPDISTDLMAGYPDDLIENLNTSAKNAGKTVYGRYIPIKKTADGQADTSYYAIAKLNNLNDSTMTSGLNIGGKTIVRFGIWGHPQLMMAINGEEIRIGQSGYYELNDFDVTSFAVVANDVEDTFILDYQYKL